MLELSGWKEAKYIGVRIVTNLQNSFESGQKPLDSHVREQGVGGKGAMRQRPVCFTRLWTRD